MKLTNLDWKKLKTPAVLPKGIYRAESGSYRFRMQHKGKLYVYDYRDSFDEALRDRDEHYRKFGLRVTRTTA